MKYYDYTYLTRQDMSEEDAKKLQDKLVASITAKSGVINDLPKAYKKRLAYRIKKQEIAYVNTILFEAQAQAIEELKKETDGIAEILRGLIISFDPEKLKREIREYPEKETSAEATPAKTETVTSSVATQPEKKEEIKEAVKEEKIEPEKKEEAKVEAKKEKEETTKVAPKEKEEVKEEKAAKPKRKTKIKAELRDIEQKLDEILK